MLRWKFMLETSLPEDVQTFVEQQATTAGFNSSGDYVYHLILREQERLAQQSKLESLLLEGLDSGEAIEVTDDWWAAKQRHLVERLQADV